MKKHLKKIVIGFIGLAILSVIALIYGFYIEPNRLVVNEHTLKIKNWNKTFNGLKIVAISDVHGGSSYITEEKIRTIVQTVNAQNPDLIVILGDFVSETAGIGSPLRMPVEKIAENLKGLKAKYGVFGVLGNHDVYYGGTRVKSILTKTAGIKMLENEIAFIEKDGQKLRIFGLKDHEKVRNWKDFSDELKTVITENEQSGDILILEHGPDVLPMITGELSISNDLRLMLAGHTHGGQVWFPIIGSLVVPSSYGQKYNYGHIKDQGLDLFVTTGIGTSILPVRFLVPPEIAVLTIQAE